MQDDMIERGEKTPLLGRNEKENIKSELEVESIKEKLVVAIAGCGFLASLLSILLESSHPSAILSGILGLILSPYVAFQQQKITQREALKRTNAQMEEEIQFMSYENDRLQGQLNSIQESVTNLQSFEKTLEMVQSLPPGESATKLEDQVAELRTILARMEQNKPAIVLQNLISLLLETDSDADMIMSDPEIDDLISNLAGLNGVHLKEDLIRQMILEKGRSISAVMALAKEALSGSDTFSYVEEKSVGEN